MSVQFSWVDVFADAPLRGNPLPVVPDADHLPVDVLQAIALEFNQSETTFLTRPSIPGADVRLRSFTPGGDEVGGAGHNALGAWIWLALSGRLDPARTAFLSQIGEALIDVTIGTAPDGRVRVTLQQSAPAFLHAVDDPRALAESLGLDAGALVDRWRPEVVSTGAEHLLVRVRDAASVDASEPDRQSLRRLLAEYGAEGCYVYALDHSPGTDAVAYARFFNPTVGIVEDPATGTAAGPLAALLVRDGVAVGGEPIRIEQGTKLGRQSILTLVVEDHRVLISGSGIIAAEGTLHL